MNGVLIAFGCSFGRRTISRLAWFKRDAGSYATACMNFSHLLTRASQSGQSFVVSTLV